MRATWQHDAPNHGFHLRDGDAVVGAYVALYSRRTFDGVPVRVCNLAAWCVDDDFRFKGIRLLQALLGQPDFVFTDLSPSGNVIALNQRLGFHELDVETSLTPNVPWPAVRRNRRVTEDLAEIEAALTGDALRIFLDHRDAPAVRHVALIDGSTMCHVIYRRVRRKGIQAFAAVLYVSDQVVFESMFRRFSQLLLLRHGIPFTLLERRIGGFRPGFASTLKSPRPKMFRGTLQPEQLSDDLYSEMVAVPW